ncbi:pirin family protein [Emticicia sp. C21]|uniref:pirin family protein n=1 Tax=Emticicia sp. C21 TaxID=2302915 RepID=UPI000E34B2F2|nr:pirin family protein [Emticicia sp. C21]RFS18285.1 pirin family protein [Emticicia sp. C21]
MSNISLIIEERPHDIGNFMVGRLLPFRGKRTVGPFIFLDHMGPACMGEYQNIDVPPHPHIGLSTLTYLFEGSIMHRDSLGVEMEIKPGQVNWMTAGKGIVHSERTPEYLRASDKMLHGLQIWVAMPKGLEDMDPSFYHASEDVIPTWENDGVAYKLIAGTAFGHKSPVPVYSKLFLLELKSTNEKTIKIGHELFGEVAMYILEGSIENQGISYEPKRILVAKQDELCEFTIKENTSIYIFGGEPFPEERFIYWNFVSSSKETIDEAKIKWQEQTFPKIPGETEFVPLPT